LTPIPPYIRKARQTAGIAISDAADRDRYQTVFADAQTVHGGLGSVAAPTAGLHFTPGLLAELERLGVERADVVLHVGPGTFRPVETAIVEEHPMHAEWCSMPHTAIEAIGRTRARGGRVVCVGTTSARVVETYAAREERGEAYEAWVETRILITPGYRWRWVDGLLTNFHLPRSTLMAMVAALLDGGVERLKGVYSEAISQGYRFYSYGDAMLVVE
jgi:S-adenosylmethionine:tRNA ribosyltransferase-isomerase